MSQEKQTAEEVLANHTREHFALNSNVFAAKNDILKAMEEYANLKLQEKDKEIERLKGEIKEVNDKEMDAFIGSYINDLPDGWNSRLDMILAMKNAMIEALSYKEKYLTNH